MNNLPYVPFWNKTCHSFLEGASYPEELVDQASQLEINTLAITDRNGFYGAVRAHIAAEKTNVRLIIGAEIYVSHLDLPPSMPDIPTPIRAADRLILLAQNKQGYKKISRLLTRGHKRAPKGESLISLKDLLSAEADGVFFLVPSVRWLNLLYPLYGTQVIAFVCRAMTESAHRQEVQLRLRARELGLLTVGSTEVRFHKKERKPLSDVLTCIRHRTTLRDAGTLISSNAEMHLRSNQEFSRLYEDAPELILNGIKVAEQCTFSFDLLDYRYPEEAVPEQQSVQGWLRELTHQGARARYSGKIPGDIQAQLNRELELIRELNYGGYFLTMYEIVQFCKKNGILCQGRGSAANSSVCFCLGITAVDPVRMGLLFERFLSRERAEPPDIDLDIEHTRREEVIQHVYRRYGKNHSAMVANIVRYRLKSALREVGKVLQIDTEEIDAVARLTSRWGGEINAIDLKAAGLDRRRKNITHWLELTKEIQGFPRHLSIHPGGFILGNQPVCELAPVEPAAMKSRSIIQWDKHDVEALGLFKVDLLALGSLSAIHKSLDLIEQHKKQRIEMAEIPADDPATFAMISSGNTVGVFQIESRAQMAMLPRLKPRRFYDLVIEVAIVRPGPIQGDMVHPYLRRRNGEEPVTFPHTCLEATLKRTLGVPLFQEQVMKIAILAANYSPGEADQLRRDMAAWRESGKIEKHRDRLINRMVERGISLEFAERVYSHILGFGEYGFPESHAASFALLAYVTAWLRCRHPEVFLCAMLNSQPMGFYSSSTLIEDGRRNDVEVRPAAINASVWDCILEPSGNGWAVRMGLRLIKGFSQADAEKLSESAPYCDFRDCVKRSGLSLTCFQKLTKAGIFDSFKRNRRELLWELKAIYENNLRPLPFESRTTKTNLAGLTPFEQISWDFRAMSHSTCGHPMETMRSEFRKSGIPDAKELNALADGSSVRYAGMVICRQRPQTASGVTFFTLEDETGLVNLVLWKNTFDRHAAIAKTLSLLGVSGTIQRAEGVTHLVAKALWDPKPVDSKVGVCMLASRDFH
ncbi:MAG: error-prone DNA polymerase [Myxococcota bacterium]